jgi:hypothetical protein
MGQPVRWEEEVGSYELAPNWRPQHEEQCGTTKMICLGRITVRHKFFANVNKVANVGSSKGLTPTIVVRCLDMSVPFSIEH